MYGVSELAAAIDRETKWRGESTSRHARSTLAGLGCCRAERKLVAKKAVDVRNGSGLTSWPSPSV